MKQRKPNVLIIAGHDPSGGAGLHADIETITQLGCHASSVITALTLQDTKNAHAVWPIEVDRIAEQLDLLCSDIQFSAVKLGLLGTPEIASVVAQFLESRLSALPLVIDPVLVASGGGELAVTSIINTYKQKLFPLAAVITPNAHERRTLASSDVIAEQAQEFLSTGAQSVLFKGGDENTADVSNTIYLQDSTVHSYNWSRFTGNFHGSGCTLASAIAAYLAHGQGIIDAVSNAQSYTWEAIRNAHTPGNGQSVPNRQYQTS